MNATLFFVPIGFPSLDLSSNFGWVVDAAVETLTVEKYSTVDQQMRLLLRELAEHRVREVRWLARRSLGYLGDFEWLVDALRDPDQKLLWPDYIGQLQEALLRGPAPAAAVRQTMEKQFGREGTSLYRMLCGYTHEQLKAGDAAKLVDYLDHDESAFRALSFWNLKSITGLTLSYQPEATASKRQLSVQRWRERLEAGALWQSK